MEVVSETGSRFDLEGEPARELIEKILARPLFAHLATASERGPRESPVWFLWEVALWIIGNYKTDSFPSRIEREPRCAVGIVDFDISAGVVRHVGFRGHAHLEPHDSDRMRRLLSRYMANRGSGTHDSSKYWTRQITYSFVLNLRQWSRATSHIR
jgi:hypothetical protein